MHTKTREKRKKNLSRQTNWHNAVCAVEDEEIAEDKRSQECSGNSRSGHGRAERRNGRRPVPQLQRPCHQDDDSDGRGHGEDPEL